MRSRRLAVNLSVSLGSLALTLVAIETGARLLVWRWTSEPNAVHRPFLRYDPLLGWSKPPGAEGWLRRPEYHVHLKINSKGLRGPEYDYPKPAGVHRVLLLGDSFTDGYTVAEEKSVRAQLENLLNSSGRDRFQVLNAGTAGWSTDQEYLYWRYEGKRYSPDIVVLLFYYNDLYGDDIIGIQKPYFDLTDDGQLELRNSPAPPPEQPVRTESFVIKPVKGSVALALLSQRVDASNPTLARFLARLGIVKPPVDRRGRPPAELNPFGLRNPREVRTHWRRTAALIRELDREVRAQGGRLVVTYVPGRFEINDRCWQLTRERFDIGFKRWSRDKVLEQLRQVCQAMGLPVVDPRAALRRSEQAGRLTYFPLDGHWTEVGHAIAAESLAEFLARADQEG